VNELLKRKFKGLSEQDLKDATLIPRGKGYWNGIEHVDLFSIESRTDSRSNTDSARSRTTKITTAKTTLAHQNAQEYAVIFSEVNFKANCIFHDIIVPNS
jgi:hypothetical protein